MTGTAVCIVFVVPLVKVELKWISPGPRHLWQLLFHLQLSTSGIYVGNVTSSGLNSSLPQTKFRSASQSAPFSVFVGENSKCTEVPFRGTPSFWQLIVRSRVFRIHGVDFHHFASSMRSTLDRTWNKRAKIRVITPPPCPNAVGTSHHVGHCN